jgi:hypothetical protein
VLCFRERPTLRSEITPRLSRTTLYRKRRGRAATAARSRTAICRRRSPCLIIAVNFCAYVTTAAVSMAVAQSTRDKVIC